MAEKISLIMPVYNVAEFLPRCLKSIAKQTFRDFRLIAINDGSTDNSLSILKKFAERHSFCTVIDQENAGVSEARNHGIRLAEGEYIGFIDSDDFVEPNYLEELYRLCTQNGADIGCCFHYYYLPDFKINVLHPFRCSGVFSRTEAMKKLMHDLVIQSYPWNKLFRRKLFTENNIEFPTMCFEDMATIHRLFCKANKVAVTKKLLYHYTQRKTSALKTPDFKKIEDFLHATASMRIALEESGSFEPFKDSFKALCRKTGFYASYFTVKIHLQTRTVKETKTSLGIIRDSLRFYQSSSFDCSKYFGKPLSALPEAFGDRRKK